MYLKLPAMLPNRRHWLFPTMLDPLTLHSGLGERLGTLRLDTLWFYFGYLASVNA